MSGQSRKLLRPTSTLFVPLNMNGEFDEISIIIRDHLYLYTIYYLLFDMQHL